MSPVRFEDDRRRRQIENWDDFARDAITQMVERGELEHLPDQGKPIHIWRTEVDPEKDFAYSRLKNAGYKPVWMELDQDIALRTTRLDAVLETAAQMITAMRREIDDPPGRDAVASPTRWQRLIAWLRLDTGDDGALSATSLADVIAERDRWRNRFLKEASALDKKVMEYHAALPRELAHLQRLRWLPDRAARVFDERIPMSSVLGVPAAAVD